MGRHDRLSAVVLAGGRSRRFGSDKLNALLHGRQLLDVTIAGLPADIAVVVVGPERPLERPARFVREEPPGGGPAAALVAGLNAALTSSPDRIVVLPGDGPRTGAGCPLLLAALDEHPGVAVVVAVDERGVDQPLQLALRPAGARALIRVAGPGSGQSESVRALVRGLEPAPLRVQLPQAWCDDIDTIDDLSAFARPAEPADPA